MNIDRISIIQLYTHLHTFSLVTYNFYSLKISNRYELRILHAKPTVIIVDIPYLNVQEFHRNVVENNSVVRGSTD